MVLDRRKVRPGWTKHGFQGYGLIEFGMQEKDFKSAMKLERKFVEAEHGKSEWHTGNRDGSPYLWVATNRNHQFLKIDHIGYIYAPNEWRVSAAAAAANEIDDAFERLSRRA
ncbi:Factor of DNA methylation 3 [Bienertia sinuspersici]